ncbi:hypothetical protein IWX46DRAFT_597827 [Phyllosticta citricarpa]|uniref:Uncharacterized protein n=1 Tax=Phyllosticta citricarpa TaxID=55181 RepID=A0ABR1MJ43_9PEZI
MITPLSFFGAIAIACSRSCHSCRSYRSHPVPEPRSHLVALVADFTHTWPRQDTTCQNNRRPQTEGNPSPFIHSAPSPASKRFGPRVTHHHHLLDARPYPPITPLRAKKQKPSRPSTNDKDQANGTAARGGGKPIMAAVLKSKWQKGAAHGSGGQSVGDGTARQAGRYGSPGTSPRGQSDARF